MLYRKILSILTIFLLLVAPVFAQEEIRVSTNGTITQSHELEDTLFIGGSFSEVSVNNKDVVLRNNLAEINLDSAAVSSWDPLPNAPVQDMLVHGNRLFIAGQFTQISNEEESYFTVVDISSKELQNIGLQLNDPVYAIALYEDVLYLGGSFTEVNDLVRRYLVSYNINSESVTTWNPDLNGNVYEITRDKNIVYIGGSFTKVNGEVRNHLAAFNLDTGELTNWNPSVDIVVTKIDIYESTIVVTGYYRNADEVEGRRITINTESNEVILEETLDIDTTSFQQTALPPELTPEPTEATIAGLMVNQKELGFKIPTLSDVLTFAIRAFFVIAGLAALFFLLLGAFGWVTSGGDQDSVDAARNKIQAAVVGLLMMVAVLAIVWTLEQVIFNRRLCFGISCPVTIPALLEPVEAEPTPTP